MNITAIAFKHNRFTLLILLFIALSGISTYQTMPRSEDPGFVIRVAQVITQFPGASPARIEQLITDKIEEKVRELPELDFVSSISKTGISIVNVNVKDQYQDLRTIWDNLRRKVQQVALPDGASVPEVNDEFGDVFGIVYAIEGDGFSYAEMKSVVDDVRNELLTITDVAKVDLHGVQQERIFIEYDNTRLTTLGLTPDAVVAALTLRNVINPGGTINTLFEKITIEPTGNYESIADLKLTLIALPNNEVVPLGDLVQIYRDYVDPPRNRMLINGEPAVGIAISMREGGNIVKLGQAVDKKITALSQQYPIGIEFSRVTFQPDVVHKTVNNFMSNLFQAIIVVSLVMLISLGLRTGLVVSSLIPMAILFSFMVMGYLGIGLDSVSLAALMIALGMLVDNSIVMSENILLQMENGKPAQAAAIDSAKELMIPLLTSSLTTAAAFLPIFLAESQTGEYTAPIFSVVTITLLCSWILSITMIPLLSFYFLKVKAHANKSFGQRFYTRYRQLLVSLLKHRIKTVLSTLCLFMVAVWSLGFVPKLFFPSSEDPFFTMEIDLPKGASLQYSETILSEVAHYLKSRWLVDKDRPEGIINFTSFVGSGAPRFKLTYGPKPASPNYSITLVNTTNFEIIQPIMQDLNQYFFEKQPDVSAKLSLLGTGSSISVPIEVRVSGKSLDTLYVLTDAVKAQLSTIAGVTQVSDDWGEYTKKIRVLVKESNARRAKITHSDVANSLQTAFSGITISEFREGDKIIPIELRSTVSKLIVDQQHSSLDVFSQTSGQSVPADQVISSELVMEPAVISRRDGLKTITVQAELLPGFTAAKVNQQLTPWLEENSPTWPPGYRWALGGEAEGSSKANQSISEKLPIAGMIILLLLVAQFNSLRKTCIILLTIPLSLIGVSFGLLVAQSYFGFMTFLGIISLAGIVINNAIVLIDRIQIELDSGLSEYQAIIEAGVKRFRPILLTTATTVLGLIPLYLGGGIMWEPMAVVIIFGLLFATGLTLGIVPVLYSIFYSVKIPKT